MLTGVAEEEEGLFVSCCRELGTASCGDTASEALENLGEAIEVHLNASQQVGELERVLHEKAIRILDQPGPTETVNVDVPLGSIVKTYSPSLNAA